MKKLLLAILVATFALTPMAEARHWRHDNDRHFRHHHARYYSGYSYYRPYYYDTGYYGYPSYYSRGCGYGGGYYGGGYGGYYGHRRHHGNIAIAFGF
jgi:hypothetical protein